MCESALKEGFTKTVVKHKKLLYELNEYFFVDSSKSFLECAFTSFSPVSMQLKEQYCINPLRTKLYPSLLKAHFVSRSKHSLHRL